MADFHCLIISSDVDDQIPVKVDPRMGNGGGSVIGLPSGESSGEDDNSSGAGSAVVILESLPETVLNTTDLNNAGNSTLIVEEIESEELYLLKLHL